ncbi:hypothetical protein MOOR_18160 [Moorella thermoacetica]|uniref:Zinc-ribbon domain-containing protein n=1 Tax=Neomoorella thermoacetica TaxID=1525 RepID=A0A1J5JGJ6_NEOTH|nr:FxLYD domain-containing protein [Moorella thermoacetica]OIQ08662.1 hypothetical protein MOOR_18160 [Moorella thermoacetica]
MFCQYCGKKIEEGSRFCSGCGHELRSINNEDTVVLARPSPDQVKQEEGSEHTTAQQQVPAKGKSIWLLPLATAVLVAVVLGGYYAYEQYINRLVEQDRVQAENLALQGDLDKAEKLISNALNKRLRHKTLQADLAYVREGQEVQSELNEAWEHTKQQQFNQALSLIEQAEKKVSGKEGDFYKYLSQLINDKKAAVNIMQVKQEMNNKNSIEELAALLTKISSFKVKEAQEVAKVIKTKICQLIYTKANELLKKKDFAGALALVQQGLGYDSENQQLLSFQKTIEQQKAAFEQNEQMILEQAQLAAARENAINHTQAVEVLQCDGSVTAQGDFRVWGTVRNVATRPIYMVEIYYTVYDAAGNALTTDSTYVYPNYLNPRDQGSFDNTSYGLWQGNRVKINRITWYLG